YTWSPLGAPPAPVNFSVNGTNAAKNTVATFTQPGAYSFQVAIVNPAAGSVFESTSSVNVTVNSTLTSVTVAPASVNLHDSSTQQFMATGYDQFGASLSSQPTFTWSATGGSVSSSGVYTAPFAAGDFQVTAASGTTSGTALAHVSLLKGDVDGDGQVTIADMT